MLLSPQLRMICFYKNTTRFCSSIRAPLHPQRINKMFKGYVPGGAKVPPPTFNQQHCIKRTGAKGVTQRPRDYFDDEDDEDDNTAISSQQNFEDEDDPLESFMASINQQAASDQANIGKSTNQRPEIVSHREDYDDVISYDNTSKPGDDDSDYEYEESEEIDEENGKKIRKAKIEPLPPLDHSTIQYPPFRKAFYKEHIDVRDMSEDEIEKFLSDEAISTMVFRGTSDSHNRVAVTIPRPIQKFHQAGFSFKLQQEIERQGLEKPTAIQSQALPIILAGYDLLALAKTGSGKTFAYVWPMIIHILDQPHMEIGDGPIGLILSPTRELATQIYQETKRFGKVYNIRTCPIYGGAGKWEMTKALKEAPEIVVATPGRLIEMIRIKATNLRRCTMVVLDEADRMFEMGFEYQMRSIVNQIRPNRQMLMFSATMKKKIESFAKDMLSHNNDMIRLAIGNIGQANPDIQQRAEIVSNDELKWLWLAERIDEFAAEGKVLIFVLTKATADLLCGQLQSYLFKRQLDISVDTLHGDKDQQERNIVMQRFAKPSTIVPLQSSGPSSSTSRKAITPCHVLIATDIASRGLDVKDVRTVINYDVAKNIETYVHRIGRTGRMGVQGVTPGTAFTLITPKESSFAVDLVQNLRLSSQPVSEDLLQLAMSDPKWGRIKHFGAGGRGGGSGVKGGLGSNSYGSGFATKAMTSEMLAKESSFGGIANHTRVVNNDSGFNTRPRSGIGELHVPRVSTTQSNAPVMKGFVRASSSYHSVSGNEIPANISPPLSSQIVKNEDPNPQPPIRKRSRWDT